MSFIAAQIPNPIDQLIERVSDLVRIKAYCLRFIRNSRQTTSGRETGPLTDDEYDASLHRLVTIAQKRQFSVEFTALQRGQGLSSSSRLKSLNTFVEPDGSLRMSGRLENSLLSYGRKHPLILPAGHALTIFMDALVRRYWILKARTLVRKLVFSCTVCFKLKSRTVTQMMGNLPSFKNPTFLSIYQLRRPYPHQGQPPGPT